MAESFLTPVGRVSFPSVFKPKKFDDGDEPKFELSLIWEEGADLDALRAEVDRVAKEKFGPKLPKNFRYPLRDGEEKDNLDGYGKGMIFARASSTIQPELLDRAKQEIISEREFYAGCYARAFFTVFAYDTKGNRGVSFGLRAIQKVADGEAFGGGGSMADKFDELSDEEVGGDGDDMYN